MEYPGVYIGTAFGHLDRASNISVPYESMCPDHQGREFVDFGPRGTSVAQSLESGAVIVDMVAELGRGQL
jgi:hypothetical protein